MENERRGSAIDAHISIRPEAPDSSKRRFCRQPGASRALIGRAVKEMSAKFLLSATLFACATKELRA